MYSLWFEDHQVLRSFGSFTKIYQKVLSLLAACEVSGQLIILSRSAKVASDDKVG